MRVLGRWPLAVFGDEGLPRTLHMCPLCGLSSVDVTHVLHACPGTWDLYAVFCGAAGIDCAAGNRISWTRLRLELFADRICFLDDCTTIGAARIVFVGMCVERVARLLAVDDDSISELISSAAACTHGICRKTSNLYLHILDRVRELSAH